MELHHFVAETIKSVVEGIQLAQTHAAEHDASVNPFRGSELQSIDFEIELSTSEGTESSDGEVVVGGVASGATAQQKAGSETVGRIKFKVPLRFPNQPAKRD